MTDTSLSFSYSQKVDYSSTYQLSQSRKMEDIGEAMPISPADAIEKYGHKLSTHELQEIAQYPEIWYLGIDSQKIKDQKRSLPNKGFDDKSGRYIPVLHDHIAYRYEIEEVKGMGIASIVLKCFDHKTSQPVAIKVIRNRRKIHLQALLEVKILSSLNKHFKPDEHHIVHMIDHFYFRNHLCIKFELMSVNLYELMTARNFQGLDLSIIRRYAHSLLQFLKTLYHESIVHGDLKPENIMVKPNGDKDLKVIDFGSSCYEREQIYTYIQSRFYRSPEVILGITYGPAIDMWSLGTILAELYTGEPLFPGENEKEQLSCIMEVLGPPPSSLVSEAQKKDSFFDPEGSPLHMTNSKGHTRRPGTVALSAALQCEDETFVDFIHKCLTWNPNQRTTPTEGLQHEWITKIHQTSDFKTPVTIDLKDFPSKSFEV